MDDIIFEKDYRQKEDSEEDIRRAQSLTGQLPEAFSIPTRAQWTRYQNTLCRKTKLIMSIC